MNSIQIEKINYLWKDKKRYFGLPISFTRYAISEDRLFIKTGLLNERQEEVLLYRAKDITVTRTLWQKMFGVGTIHLDTNDTSTPKAHIQNIKNAENVKELLHKEIEKAKQDKGMNVAEIY